MHAPFCGNFALRRRPRSACLFLFGKTHKKVKFPRKTHRKDCLVYGLEFLLSYVGVEATQKGRFYSEFAYFSSNFLYLQASRHGGHGIVNPRSWPPSGTHPPPGGVVPFQTDRHIAPYPKTTYVPVRYRHAKHRFCPHHCTADAKPAPLEPRMATSPPYIASSAVRGWVTLSLLGPT